MNKFKIYGHMFLFVIGLSMLSNFIDNNELEKLDNIKEITFAMDHAHDEYTQLAQVSQTSYNKIDFKQLECMAKNIYFESRGEPLLGQIAVARVVMNRIEHGFANTPCKVIYQSKNIIIEETYKRICQFSWVCQNFSLDKQTAEYKKAKQIAYEILAYDKYQDVIPKNVLFFHNTSVKPKWPYKKHTVIGNHIFYTTT